MDTHTTEAGQRPTVTPKDVRVPAHSDWCPGCGDFGVLNALTQALAALGRRAHEVVMVGGIGCSGKTPYYVHAYGVHTLHGRAFPYATGIKLANPELTVIVTAGDGDGFAIGAGHFVNAGRRNVDMTYIVFNNGVYGLTKGQASPTLPLGLQTKSLPEPNIQGQVNSLLLALTSGYTWIGRGYAYDVKHLSDMMQLAIRHPGLSYLEVLQPCPTYNNIHTREWYAGQDLGRGQARIYDVNKEGYDPLIPPAASGVLIRSRMLAFMEKASEWGDRIPIGVLLENHEVSSFEDRIDSLLSAYCQTPPAKRAIADAAGRPTADLTALLDELAVR